MMNSQGSKGHAEQRVRRKNHYRILQEDILLSITGMIRAVEMADSMNQPIRT